MNATVSASCSRKKLWGDRSFPATPQLSMKVLHSVDDRLDASLDHGLGAVVARAGEFLITVLTDTSNVDGDTARVADAGKSIHFSVRSDVRVVRTTLLQQVPVTPAVHAERENSTAADDYCAVLVGNFRSLSHANSKVQQRLLLTGRGNATGREGDNATLAVERLLSNLLVKDLL